MSKIYLDIDGVLADFVSAAQRDMGLEVRPTESWAFYEEAGMTKNDFEAWLFNQPRDFWANIELLPNSCALVDAVEKIDPGFSFLSHSVSNEADHGKAEFIRQNFGDRHVGRLVTVRKSEHKACWSGEGKVLIDDSPQNLADWALAGGRAVRSYTEYNHDTFPERSMWVQDRNAKDLQELIDGPNDPARALKYARLPKPTQPTPSFSPCPRSPCAPGPVADLTDVTLMDYKADVAEETRITNPDTGAEKNSKPIRIDLIAPAFLEELGRVYHFGSGKYAAHNYRRGYEFSLSLAALHRHLNAWNGGEDNDSESGHSHLAHVAWHCAALIQSQVDHGDRFDDRYKAEVADSAEETP